MQIEKLVQRKDYQNLLSFVSSSLGTAKDIKIKKEEDEKSAIELRGDIKENIKRAKEMKDFFVTPHKKFIKLLEEKFSFIKDMETTADILGGKLVEYQEKKEDKVEKEKEKLLKKNVDGGVDLADAVSAIEKVGTAEKSVESNGRKITYREDRYVEVEDETKIPREYLSPNFVLIRKEALAGKVIPGIVVKTKKTIVQL